MAADELERLTEACVARGYHPHLRRGRDDWECELSCGVDVAPGCEPRPRASGPTATFALRTAMERGGVS